ncbi:hypothetical protein METP3_00640 [Methanosarcinales archaeon]|nr:hypothetical protein METP3_00640 [Methanosarcinales archaeon]
MFRVFGANLTVKYYDINGVLAQIEYPNITAKVIILLTIGGFGFIGLKLAIILVCLKKGFYCQNT